MIPVKVQCGCGQAYAFDVEPVNGRMPSTVACPMCGADGTAASNEIIAQTLSASQPSPIQPAPLQQQDGVVVMSGREAASALIQGIAAASRRSGNDDSDGSKWKWWYFILAGICIGGFSIWQSYDKHSIKPLGSLFLAVLCIAIGIWDFLYKRRKNKQ